MNYVTWRRRASVGLERQLLRKEQFFPEDRGGEPWDNTLPEVWNSNGNKSLIFSHSHHFSTSTSAYLWVWHMRGRNICPASVRFTCCPCEKHDIVIDSFLQFNLFGLVLHCRNWKLIEKLHFKKKNQRTSLKIEKFKKSITRNIWHWIILSSLK